MATGIKRDTTLALGYVLGALNTNNPDERTKFLNEAARILRDSDARTGRRDPSKRKARKAKP